MEQPAITTNNRFICDTCGKTFSRADHLTRHQSSVHGKKKYACNLCNYVAARSDTLKRHVKGFHQNQINSSAITNPPLHNASGTKSLNNESQKRKRKGDNFENLKRAQIEKTAEAEIELSRLVPRVSEDSENITKLYEDNKDYIDSYKFHSKRLQDRYNFKIRDPKIADIMGYVAEIVSEQKSAFKINLSFGFILRNYFSGELSFYYASNNNRILNTPVLISDVQSIDNLSSQLGTQDFLEYCRQHRPNTKLIVDRITNVMFYINKIKRHPIGQLTKIVLPGYIANKRSIIAFVKDRKGVPYADNLCIFRCLAYHRTSRVNEQLAVDYARQYCEAKGIDGEFPGICLEDLNEFEDLFKVGVNIYELLHPEDIDILEDDYAETIRISACRYEEPRMKLNLFGSHFSYILNLNKYARSWTCSKCTKRVDHHGHLVAHERNCTANTRFCFPGGGYGSPKTVFDHLAEFGFVISDEDKFYPFRAAFDFEAMCVPCSEDPNLPVSEKRKFLFKMIPASVSICSNVPGYEEPKCFISDGNVMQLIGSMYDYMIEISSVSYAIMSEKFEFILTELEILNDQYDKLTDEASSELETDNMLKFTELRNRADDLIPYVKLLAMLQKWLKQLVVLGFNSGKFDLCLIRNYFFPYLLDKQISISNIIKKANDYLSVETEELLFLDIKNYLAAGTSYDAWIRSYHIEQTKGFWPYQWFSSLGKLDEKLPEQNAFYSSLRRSGISDTDYEDLRRLFESRFKSMRDMLIWYNNLDTMPFIIASQKMFEHWREIGIDIFKGGMISLPGLALTYLIKAMEKHTILPLFNEKHKDIYETMRANVVGGLSIITHRYHEAGVTRLPNNEFCGRVYSHDCNALYLWGLGEMTGTGIFAIWRPLNDFSRSLKWAKKSETETNSEFKTRIMYWEDVRQNNMDQVFDRSIAYPKSNSELQWLEWVMHHDSCRIEHKFNGRQKIVRKNRKTKYPVDGYEPKTNTIFQFHGCYWHGHHCSAGQKNPDAAEKLQNTINITADLRELGYNVFEQWECEWNNFVAGNNEVKNFLADNFLVDSKVGHIKAGHLVDAIGKGDFFGLIECDLCVPWWRQDLLEYFAEFPPICKNTMISLDDIGDHMRNYAETTGYMNAPRKSLISSYWAVKILIATPLAKWYLDNGLQIHRVYQFIQMKPKAPFEEIRDAIADHRRQADRNPAYKIIGESWKTLGNSCYGKSITKKENHKQTVVVYDSEAVRHVNSGRFHKMEEVGESAYELSLDKRRIKLDLPITVAFFVYNYAKLRNLQFVYEFLKKFLRPGSYQILGSDTDSIIAAYEHENLDYLVKSELFQEYLQTAKPQFIVTDAYTLRTPGLYKIEWSGLGFIGLCSKTYFTWSEDDSKVSSKGLSKRINKFEKNDFMNVLKTGKKGSGTNEGFININGLICHYVQQREGLAYLYIKRRVHADGVSTSPLDL